MNIRKWLHGSGKKGTAPASGPATKPDAISQTFAARASQARAMHSAGKLSLGQAVAHMTGLKATIINGPDASGFMPLSGSGSTHLDNSISTSSWFYACDVANARAASDLPAIVQTKDQNGEWERDRSHELNRLIDMPFGGAVGWPRWAWKQLAQTVFMQLPGEGNSYLKPAVVSDTAVRQRLAALFLVMRPGSVQAIESYTGGVSGAPLLGWDLGDGSPRLGPDELVNIMAPTAGSLWDGIAPMEVAARAIETDAIASARQRYNMENRISHGVIITMTDAWGMGATDEQEAKILAKLEADYVQSAKDGTPIVLGGGAKIEPPPNSEELQVFETRKFSREEIMAICGTPPPMIGDYENATLQNFDKAFHAWWMNVLFPLNHDFYGAINSQAVWPIYGTSTRLWYDVSRTDIGVMLMDAKLVVAKKILELGHTANTAAAEVGLDLEFVEELETYNRDLANAGRLPAVTDGGDGAE